MHIFCTHHQYPHRDHEEGFAIFLSLAWEDFTPPVRRRLWSPWHDCVLVNSTHSLRASSTPHHCLWMNEFGFCFGFKDAIITSRAEWIAGCYVKGSNSDTVFSDTCGRFQTTMRMCESNGWRLRKVEEAGSWTSRLTQTERDLALHNPWELLQLIITVTCFMNCWKVALDSPPNPQ